LARIYISSTFDDLKRYREAVSMAIRRMGHVDVAMEYYTAEDRRPLDRCLADVRSSDIYIGLFAWRYGYVPAGTDRSITEHEYRTADASPGTTTLCFILDEDHPWPPRHIERGSGADLLAALKTHIRARHSAPAFADENDLAAKITQAIAAWERRNVRVESEPRVPAIDVMGYARKMAERYGRLDLEALVPPERDEGLDVRLPQIFVEQSVRVERPPLELPKDVLEMLEREGYRDPLDLPSGVTKEDLARARSAFQERPARRLFDVLGLPGTPADVGHGQRVVLLGDPGSGKSTLTRYVLLSLLDGAGDPRVRAAYPGALPLLIELRDYAATVARGRSDTFIDYLDMLGDTQGWALDGDALRAHLQSRAGTLVIFDGLDELFERAHRDEITRRIAGFASDYPDAAIIVTSRIIGYAAQTLRAAGFSHHTIQDFDRARIDTFARAWFRHVYPHRPDEARICQERILEAADHSRSIRELAGNPLLLTIMAIISRHQELPRERAALFEHATSVLVQHWHLAKRLDESTVETGGYLQKAEKLELLRRIAWHMQGTPGGLRGNFITGADLEAQITAYLRVEFNEAPPRAIAIARAMIDQLRTRNFILCRRGAELYGFIHRSFLEYFCATSIQHRFERTRELDLAGLRAVFEAHWEEPAWREVLRLVAGLIDPTFAAKVIEYLATGVFTTWPREFGERTPWNLVLAAQCLGEVRNLSSVGGAGARVLERVFALLTHGAQIEDAARNQLLLDELVPAVAFLGVRWPGREAARPWFLRYAPQIGWWPLSDVWSLLAGHLFEDDTEVRGALLAEARTHPYPMVSKPAADFVRRVWTVEPPSPRDLCRLAVVEMDGSLRMAALEALARMSEPPDAFWDLVRNRSVHDRSGQVRSAALSLLAQRRPTDDGTRALLLQRAVHDRDEDVREAALTSIAVVGIDPDDLNALIRARAVYDGAWNVRYRALSLLVGGRSADDDTWSLVRDRATVDADGDVRSRALSLLATARPGVDVTWRLVRDTAARDANHAVRRKTLVLLTTPGAGGGDAWSVIAARAAEDPHADVRAAALTLLATTMADRDDTWTLVAARAASDVAHNVRRAALSAVAAARGDRDATRSLLHSAALGDRDERVREEAVSLLATKVPHREDSWRLIRNLAIEDVDAAVRACAVERLGTARPDHDDTWRLAGLRAAEDPAPTVRARALTVLVCIRPGRADTWTLVRARAVVDAAWKVRRSACGLLASGQAGQEDTWTLLRERATADEAWSVRLAALSLVAVARAGDDSILDLLTRRASEDDSADVREAALLLLASGYADHSTAWPLVRARAVADADRHVRRRALSLYASAHPAASELAALLQDRALGDPDGEIRESAMALLARGWSEQRETWGLLRARATDDPSDSVRERALACLAASWSGQDDTWALLAGQALADASHKVRERALLLLVAGHPERPETWQLVRDRAVRDAHSAVRERALSTLTTVQGDRVETWSFVRDRAAADSDGSVRFLSTALVATTWGDRPDVWELVRTRVLSDDDWSVRHRSLRLLTSGRPEEDETWRIVRACACDDDADMVREQALSLLASTQSGDATWTLVQRRATEDPAARVRRFAVGLLAAGRRDADEAWSAARAQARDDVDAGVRRGAAGLLIGRFCTFGALCLFSAELNGEEPLLDPAEPLPQQQLFRFADAYRVDPAEIDRVVEQISTAFGWDVRRGPAAMRGARS
jgi:hypothetical protein